MLELNLWYLGNLVPNNPGKNNKTGGRRTWLVRTGSRTNMCHKIIFWVRLELIKINFPANFFSTTTEK